MPQATKRYPNESSEPRYSVGLFFAGEIPGSPITEFILFLSSLGLQVNEYWDLASTGLARFSEILVNSDGGWVGSCTANKSKVCWRKQAADLEGNTVTEFEDTHAANSRTPTQFLANSRTPTQFLAGTGSPRWKIYFL